MEEQEQAEIVLSGAVAIQSWHENRRLRFVKVIVLPLIFGSELLIGGFWLEDITGH